MLTSLLIVSLLLALLPELNHYLPHEHFFVGTPLAGWQYHHHLAPGDPAPVYSPWATRILTPGTLTVLSRFSGPGGGAIISVYALPVLCLLAVAGLLNINRPVGQLEPIGAWRVLGQTPLLTDPPPRS